MIILIILLLLPSFCLAQSLEPVVKEIPSTLKCEKKAVLFSKYIAQKTSYEFIEDIGFREVIIPEHMYYLYRTNEEVPVEKDELIEKRTKNAQFFIQDGEKIGKFYAGEPFYLNRKTRKWYRTANEMITVQGWETHALSFDYIKPQMWIHRVIPGMVSVVCATETTLYSGSGDGEVGRYLKTTWAKVRDNPDGTAYDYEDPVIEPVAYKYLSWYSCARAFVPIDTSALPDDCTITDAKLYLYYNSISGGGQQYLVQSSQASPTELTTGDFDECGDLDNPTYGSDDPIGIWSTGWKHFTLNATGIGWISKTSWTLLGVREYNDVTDTTPTNDYYAQFYSSESESGDNPYLLITYTEAGTSSSSSSSTTTTGVSSTTTTTVRRIMMME